MPTFLSSAAQHLLRFTLYGMMRSSDDFKDIKSILDDRTDWSIELFRNCFTIHLGNGSHLLTVCTMLFLVTAEGIRLHYGRLSPRALKERVEMMGYATFAVLFAVLDIGVVIVRIAGLVSLSATPGVAASLVFVSMVPSVVLPFVICAVNLCKRREGRPGGEGQLEAGVVADETGEN